MKNVSSAKRNTLAASVVSMVANGDTITPEHRFKADFIAEQKAAERARNADVKHGQKNAQSNQGAKKSRTTRAKAGKTNVAAILETPKGRDDTDETVRTQCEAIKAAHEKLAAGQIAQLDAFISQGQALVSIKAALVDPTKHETEKALDRAFGSALKQAGIGDDIIPRQSRGLYIWLAENGDAAKAFVSDCLAKFADDPKACDKVTRSIATKYKAVKLSPYIIQAAMTPKEASAERTAMDTAKAHLKQVMKDAAKKLDKESADYDAKILEQAKALLDAALAELNV